MGGGQVEGDAPTKQGEIAASTQRRWTPRPITTAQYQAMSSSQRENHVRGGGQIIE
jgi:hypothetical protein